jgi:hypothetical protein
MSITTRAPYGAELEYMPINAFGGINQFKLNPVAQAFAGQPDLHGGGGIGKILGVVAAIAIPFAAPFISSAIGLSTAIGATMGSALTGAVLGGVTSAATGGDWRRGALMGGIGGGISGYSAGATAAGAPASTTGATTTAATAPVGGGTTAAGQFYGPNSVFTGGPSAGLAGTGTGAEYGAWMGTQAGQQAAQQATGLSSSIASTNPTAPQNVFNTGGGTQVGVNTATAPAGSNVFNTGAQTTAAPGTFAGTPNTNVMAGATNTAAAATTPSAVTTGTASSFSQALKQVPSTIANRFQDPKVLADITLRAAGSLLGSAMAGDGLTAEERNLMNAQVEDLKKLREQDQTLFNQRLQAAIDKQGEAKYFDPEQFGLQSARRAQTDIARQQRAGLRGTSGEKRGYLERQYALEGGRRTGTAFDIGFGQGVAAKSTVQQAGVNMLPTSAPYGATTSGYGAMSSMYSAANERKRREAEGFGSLYGDITGISKSSALG